MSRFKLSVVLSLVLSLLAVGSVNAQFRTVAGPQTQRYLTGSCFQHDMNDMNLTHHMGEINWLFRSDATPGNVKFVDVTGTSLGYFADLPVQPKAFMAQVWNKNVTRLQTPYGYSWDARGKLVVSGNGSYTITATTNYGWVKGQGTLQVIWQDLTDAAGNPVIDGNGNRVQGLFATGGYRGSNMTIGLWSEHGKKIPAGYDGVIPLHWDNTLRTYVSDDVWFALAEEVGHYEPISFGFEMRCGNATSIGIVMGGIYNMPPMHVDDPMMAATQGYPKW